MPPTPTSRPPLASWRAHDFISSSPTATTPMVGEHGLTLSGGQRQRIALARASSPTRPCSYSTTRRRRSTPAPKKPSTPPCANWTGRTTVLIAHRRSTLRLADRVLVIDGGRIVAGTNAELWRRPRSTASSSPAPRRRGIDRPATSTRARRGDRPRRRGHSRAQILGRRAQRTRRSTPPPRPWRSRHRRRGRRAVAAPSGAGAGLTATPELLAAVERCRRRRRPRDRPAAEADRQRRTSACGDFGSDRTGGRCSSASASSSSTPAPPWSARFDVPRASTTACRSTPHARCRSAWRCPGGPARQLGRTWAYTRYTGRTAERMLYTLRVRTFAHLQRLVARLLRQGDGRADHDPHDHRRRGVGAAAAAGLCRWR